MDTFCAWKLYSLTFFPLVIHFLEFFGLVIQTLKKQTSNKTECNCPDNARSSTRETKNKFSIGDVLIHILFNIEFVIFPQTHYYSRDFSTAIFCLLEKIFMINSYKTNLSLNCCFNSQIILNDQDRKVEHSREWGQNIKPKGSLYPKMVNGYIFSVNLARDYFPLAYYMEWFDIIHQERQKRSTV